MKIILITQWYKPLRAAAANRTSRMAEALIQQGHQVLVLTGMPNYPTGVLPQKYRWKFYLREKINKVKILHVYEYPTPNKGVFKRVINNISFMLSASIATLFIGRHDLIIVSSPPFLSGISGLLASYISKSKFIFDIRDLYPDSMIELGYVKLKWIKRVLEKLERKYYNSAHKIITATPSIKEHLIKEKVESQKIEVLLNSVDTNFFKPKIIDRKKYGFTNDDFIISYTGTLGSAQGLETTLKAASLLKKYPKIKFLFVGEGEEKEKLKKMSKNNKNILFWDEVNRQEIVKIINFSDCGNISLASNNIFQQAIPSKALEYFACAKPVIASVDGLLKKYIMTYQTGLIYKNPETMARVILDLNKNPLKKYKMGQNGRQLTLETFSQQKFYQGIETFIAK